MTRDLGLLLIGIDNAVTTVFGDDAHITHLVPSLNYYDDGILLNITISVFRNRYDDTIFATKMDIFNQLVYNPVFHSDKILSKIDIEFMEL